MNYYDESPENKGCGILFLLILFIVGTIVLFIAISTTKFFNDEKLIKSSFSPTKEYQIEIFAIGTSGNILIKEATTSSELKATVDTYELNNISKDEISIIWTSDTTAEISTESKTNIRFCFKFDSESSENSLTKKKCELIK